MVRVEGGRKVLDNWMVPSDASSDRIGARQGNVRQCKTGERDT